MEPANDAGLEESCELGLALRPGHLDELDAVLGALHSRHIGAENGLELTGIQMPPAPNPGVVLRAQAPAERTRQPSLRRADLDLDRLLRGLESNVDDLPELQTEDCFIQRKLQASGHGFTQLDEEPRSHFPGQHRFLETLQ